MKSCWDFDTDEARRSLLSRARDIALWAIQEYEINWDSIRFVQLSDTITYKIETSEAGSYLLRIHSDRLTKEEIGCELLFLKHLSAAQGVMVPVGIPSREGSYVLTCETEDGFRALNVSLMKWVEGEHMRGGFADPHLDRMGAMIARLHVASSGYEIPGNFARPHWGISSFEAAVLKLERYYPRFLSDASWMLYRRAIDKVIAQMAHFPQNFLTYGLIHADLHSGNIVFNNGFPSPIDFGRCGYGYLLYDLAAIMLELDSRQRQLLIEGYERVRKLEGEYGRELECFFIKIMIENYSHHSSDSREIASLMAEQTYALAYMREFVEDRPFLFEGSHS